MENYPASCHSESDLITGAPEQHNHPKRPFEELGELAAYVASMADELKSLGGGVYR